MTVIVHHLNNSRSQRILFLLEELGVAYEIKHYKRTALGTAPPDLTAVHPLGKSPVIQDGDLTIAESGAIIQYLVDYHDPEHKFKPAADDAAGNIQFNYWLHVSEGSLAPYLTFLVIFSKTLENVPFIISPIINAVFNRIKANLIHPSLQKQLAFVEVHLEKNDFFCGNSFTGADAMMSFSVEAALKRVPAFVGPKTRAWLEKVQARPTWAVALEKGGPYALM
ncbi:glutathione S-transferase III [Cladochytrium replicatum]|nr:glutathione S-transferase III [Cladochytrium replicatum]